MSSTWGPAPRFAEAAPRVANEAANASGLSASEAVRMGLFGPVGDNFGPAVTDSSAMRVATVYACLVKLGGAISQLPLHDYRLDKDGERERITPPTPIWWMLNESPADNWTAASWKEWIIRCIYLRGDQHTEILRRRGEPVGFKIHHPDNSRARLRGGRLVYDCRDVETGQVYGVDQDDMLHFAGFGFDGVSSMSAIKWAARNSIASALGSAQYMGKTITEGGMPRVVLEYASKVDKELAKDLRDQFIEIYGDGQGGKLPLVMGNGGKAHELSIDPVDMELLESRKFDKYDICQVMGVPPIILGDSEKSTSFGSGIEQIAQFWVRWTIKPLLTRLDQELNRKLYRRSGRFVEFNLSALLSGDSKAQNESYRAALGGPGTGDAWMTVNQVRKLQNLPADPDPKSDQLYKAPDKSSTTKTGNTPKTEGTP